MQRSYLQRGLYGSVRTDRAIEKHLTDRTQRAKVAPTGHKVVARAGITGAAQRRGRSHSSRGTRGARDPRPLCTSEPVAQTRHNEVPTPYLAAPNTPKLPRGALNISPAPQKQSQVPRNLQFGPRSTFVTRSRGVKTKGGTNNKIESLELSIVTRSTACHATSSHALDKQADADTYILRANRLSSLGCPSARVYSNETKHKKAANGNKSCIFSPVIRSTSDYF